jgi:hypothetical protein
LDQLEPPLETSEPEPPISIPIEVVDMVDEDENAIVLVQPQQPKSPKIVIEPYKKPRRRVWLAIGLVMGTFLGTAATMLAIRSMGAIPFAIEATPTIQSPTALPTASSMPSPTIEIPTQTPVIVVVTATPPPATDVPTLTSLPQPNILFADNFDQGLSESWSIVSGSPVVVNGQLTADQNTWLKIGDNSWTDYTIQFYVQPKDCWFYEIWSAIAVRVQDSNNMVAFKWANCEGEWDIVKNGSWTTVPNSHVTGEDFTGNGTITIVVQGNQFAVEMNDKRISSFFNSDYQQGGVAIRVGAKTLIDDLKITAIQK